MKKIKMSLILFLFLLMLGSVPLTSLAGESHMVDGAGYLTEEEAITLDAELEKISDKLDTDVVIVTVNSLEGKTATAYADDYYDYNDFRPDGILLLLSKEERDFAISTTGFGITAFTDYGLDKLMEKPLKYLGQDEYFKAFNEFTTEADYFITEAKNGNVLYADGTEGEKPIGMMLLLALGAGIAVGLFWTRADKNALESVRYVPEASDYLIKDSLTIPVRDEKFLYHTISKTERVKSTSSSGGGSSTHVSSSGTTHGGSSGKF